MTEGDATDHAFHDRPDPSWRLLYRMAAISVVLYIVLGIAIPPLMIVSIQYDAELNGIELLNFIAENRSWWIIIQGLVMGTAVLLIVMFAALYPALRHLEKNVLALGTVLGIGSQILYLAYFPVVNGLQYMSDQYVAASSELQRQALAAGAEALVAQNNAYGPSEAVMALAILLISIVMLKGVFPRWVAWLGMLALPAALIGGLLKSTLGIVYLWWWAIAVVWFIAVGFKFFELGWSGAENDR